MARVTPYGDQNAHGSLAGSLSFRRSRGGVILQKKPRPHDPKSQGQLAQRLAFAQANASWFFYDPLSKPFISARATQLGLTSRQLFTRASLLGVLPAPVHVGGWEVTAFQPINLAGRTDADMYCEVALWDAQNQGWNNMGVWRFDTNTWTSYGQFAYVGSKLRFWVGSTLPLPYRTGFALTLDDTNHNPLNIVAYLPAGTPDFNNGVQYFISADGSLWQEEALTHWLTTPNF